MSYAIFRVEPINKLSDLAQIGSHNKREKKAYKSNPDIDITKTKNNIAEINCSWEGNKFFDSLNNVGKLAKTILYSLNPKDMEVLATMAYSFNDGSVPGKMQLGSGWWFLDQEDGMRKQINALSSLGLLSRFIGMLTDSRSFLSYPRHEYFRRILCNVIGEDIESGRLPKSEMDYIHKMVADISYYNAKQYFNF